MEPSTGTKFSRVWSHGEACAKRVLNWFLIVPPLLCVNLENCIHLTSPDFFPPHSSINCYLTRSLVFKLYRTKFLRDHGREEVGRSFVALSSLQIHPKMLPRFWCWSFLSDFTWTMGLQDKIDFENSSFGRPVFFPFDIQRILI